MRAWLEALTTGRVWDQERDTARIRQAFVLLAQTQRTWPAPRDFLDALPPSPMPVLRLARPASNPEVAKKALAEIGRMVGSSGPAEPKAPRQRQPEAIPLSQVQAELERHYRGDKS